MQIIAQSFSYLSGNTAHEAAFCLCITISFSCIAMCSIKNIIVMENTMRGIMLMYQLCRVNGCL